MKTNPASPLSPSDALDAKARDAIARNGARVQRIDHAGEIYWVKREERLSFRMRLQKGDPHRAFVAERRAMASLAGAGLPVPPVVAEGPGYFVTPDCGVSLTEMLRDATLSPDDRLPAFRAAAQGLAGFHARGLSHGRPAIKDILWDGARATFIDLERHAAKRNRPSGHVQDLVILLFSAFAETGRPCPETAALIQAYRAADPGGIWAGAARLCRWLAWTDLMTRPVQKMQRAREFRAIPLTLAAFNSV